MKRLVLVFIVVYVAQAFKPMLSRNLNVPARLIMSLNAKPRKPALLKTALVSLGILGSSFGGIQVPPAMAADTVAVGKCLIKNCQKELAQCVLNPKCLANVVCLNTCNGRKDEAECQIKCGDYFENDVVGTFNACAVSQKKCVPQKQDDGSYPIPPLSAQVKQFDTSIWNGRWYITAGLNKAFDIFDCQVHFFTSPYSGKFYAKLFWRVNEPDGEFFTKDAVQRFVQDPKNPAHLINHDNDYLHYKDDWYILDYEKNDFVLVYYKGSNDAWDGYGGAFLYTRSPSLRPELIPRLEAAMERTEGPYRWKDFTITDNTCKKEEDPTVLREKFASKVLIQEEEQLQEALTAVRSNAVQSLDRTEKGAEKSIKFLENEVEEFAKEIGNVEKELEKDAEAVENEIKKDIFHIFGLSGKK
jgi:violaxanthin de-epoxidase